MQQEAVRLGRMVEQLIKVSLEKERQLTLSDANAEDLLRRAAEFCEPICRGHNNQIIVECHPAHIPMHINEDGIFQVLFNLITNANRQLQCGVISLSAAYDEQNEHAVVQVSDNGRGIPSELLEHVFERGVSGSGGTGLGLTISRDIVHEHGGSMEIGICCLHPKNGLFWKSCSRDWVSLHPVLNYMNWYGGCRRLTPFRSGSISTN